MTDSCSLTYVVVNLVVDDQRVRHRCDDQAACPIIYIGEVCYSRFNNLPLPPLPPFTQVANTIQQSLKKEYDVLSAVVTKYSVLGNAIGL